MRRIPKNRTSLADPRHLMRYLKQQANIDMPTIAKSEGVSVETIRRSVFMVDSYRKRNSAPEMEFAIRDFVISAVPQAKATLNSLLTATELVEMPNIRTGQKTIVKREDKTTRLEALRLTKDLMVGLQPKGPPVEVNVSQTNQVANMSAAETVEERFARLRQQAQKHNLLPPEVAGVPTHIDRDEEEELDEDEDEEEDE